MTSVTIVGLNKKIVRYDLTNDLSNRKLFNASNIWSNNTRPSDYYDVLGETMTHNWIRLFHNNVPTVQIDKSDLRWMAEAFEIGCATKKFPPMYNDELYLTVKKYDHLMPNNDSRYFIRTDYNSLKYGCHGTGPYKDIKSIIESMVTTTPSHRCFEVDQEKCTIYFLPWIDNFDTEKEFRVFVYNNKIVGISAQDMYKPNNWLDSLDDDSISKIIDSMLNYFENRIKVLMVNFSSYTMDIYYIQDRNSWYFIEPNSYGTEYAAGSSLFHWKNDENIFEGKSNYLELRYVTNKLFENN